MTNITNIEKESDKYNCLKEYLREFYRGNLDPTELILIVYFIENPNASTNWKDIQEKMPLIGKSSFYKALKNLRDKEVIKKTIGEDECPVGMVTYLLFDDHLYKIGKATNLKNRVDSMKTANPRIKIVDYIFGDYESYLHSVYQENREIREWFRFSPLELTGVLKLFKRLKNSDGKNLEKLTQIKVGDKMYMDDQNHFPFPIQITVGKIEGDEVEVYDEDGEEYIVKKNRLV
jgi:hypothetical protein